MKNKNTTSFWNKKIKKERPFLLSDPMTRDRIKIAYRFFPSNSNTVLDIGVGYGFIEEYLCKQGKITVYGNDISDLAIRDLSNRFNGFFRKESVYLMKYKDNFFDCVFALEILEHIPERRVIKVLKKIRKSLKKNGALIISIPVNEGIDLSKVNPNGHMRNYTEEIIKKELKLSGFKTIKVKKIYAFKNMYLFKKIISHFFRKRWLPNNLVILARPI
jgi:2-polyprenyl-3-methyl-5-hydroxy-6-metoxy-1,4-benzoquinol methylase